MAEPLLHLRILIQNCHSSRENNAVGHGLGCELQPHSAISFSIYSCFLLFPMKVDPNITRELDL
jgi:hypothetical protein